MQKLIQILCLIVVAAFCCCGELLQASAYPLDVPANPVFYKRYHRHRPLRNNPQLEVYEVREMYFVRRSTPRPKSVNRLTDEQLNLQIRCDFEPTLPECTKLNTYPSNDRTSSSSSTTTTTDATSTTSTTTDATTKTSTTTGSTTTSTTTTDLPFLPELPHQSEDLPDAVTDSTAEELTTTPVEDEDYPLGSDDDTEDFDDDDVEDNDDQPEQSLEAAEYVNSGGSIGGNDVTK